MTSPSGPAVRPWLDATLPTETRIDLLMESMTLSDKVAQTHQVANIDPVGDADALRAGRISSSLYASGATAGNERDAGLLVEHIDAAQRHAVDGSRLGIPVLFGRDVIHGHRTVCPIPLGLAASFDPDLAEEVAVVAAREAAVDGVAWTFAPMVDISEEPRWGRVAESLGETPVLSGRLAAALVRGFQGADVSDPERIAACAKHFAGYGLAAGGRDYDTVSVGENTLRNLHLRPFRDAVEAGVTTVMAAFNDVDGTPMHAHEHLIREVLKGEWGFDGVVVADWNGVGQPSTRGWQPTCARPPASPSAPVSTSTCAAAPTSRTSRSSSSRARWIPRSSTTPRAGCFASSSAWDSSSVRMPPSAVRRTSPLCRPGRWPCGPARPRTCS